MGEQARKYIDRIEFVRQFRTFLGFSRDRDFAHRVCDGRMAMDEEIRISS